MKLFRSKDDTFEYRGAIAFWSPEKKNYLIIDGVNLVGYSLNKEDAKKKIDKYIEKSFG